MDHDKLPHDHGQSADEVMEKCPSSDDFQKVSDLLRQLVTRADGRIAIMAGCGVNETNIRALAEATGVTEFHFSAREAVASAMRLRNDEVKMGSSEADEYSRMVTTARRVRATIAQLDANY